MRRGDIIAVLAVLALAGALLLARPGGEGKIYINGEAAQASMEVNGVAIEIDGGRARVAASPCMDQLCVHAGWIEHPGEAAVCLPQRVIVAIRGTRKGGADGVAG